MALDATTGRLKATLYRGSKQKKLGDFEFLTTVTSMPAADVHTPLGATDTRARVKRYKRALRSGQIRTFERVERGFDMPEVEGLGGFPLALATASEVMGAALALTTLIEELKRTEWRKVDVDLYLEVAESSFLLCEPGKDVLEIMLRHAQVSPTKANPFLKGAGVIGKVGAGIEAGRNLVSGTQTLATLLSPHTSMTDLAQYLDRGQTVPAWLEGVKGVVQVGTGGTGAAALVVGAGTTIATLPLSVWVGVGMVTIAMLDVLIYGKTGGDSPVEGFLKKVREGRMAQFQLDAKTDRILLPSQRIEVQNPGRSAPSERPAFSKLSRQLASLNALAKAHARKLSA